MNRVLNRVLDINYIAPALDSFFGTQVAAQEPPQFGTADTEPLMEVHPHLRRHREDHVTQVVHSTPQSAMSNA